MNKEFWTFCEGLEQNIKDSYENGVTMEEAEKLAGKFLSAQLMITRVLEDTDLDSRMKKSGLKAIKAAVYLEEAAKGDKKPTEAMLAAKVEIHELVQGEQKALDEAEVKRDKLNSYMSVFKEAHIFFRGISKGRYE